MLNTIEGIFRNGRIELAELPAGLTEARVIVTFLPLGNSAMMDHPEPAPRRQPRQPGSARGRLIVLAEDKEHLRDFAEYMPS